MNSSRKVDGNVDRSVDAGHLDPPCAAPRASRWTLFTLLFYAVGEGVGGAVRYEALASKTNAELADLGLRRADLPRLVVFGNG